MQHSVIKVTDPYTAPVEPKESSEDKDLLDKAAHVAKLGCILFIGVAPCFLMWWVALS